MKKVVTHNKGFHSDDVFAVAVLQLVYSKENLQILRTRDEEIIDAADIVVDVGGIYDPAQERFDHHQKGAPIRDNGIPYAAIGLVWQAYGEQLTTPYAARKIDENIIQPIDAGDNGVSIYEVNEYGTSPILLQHVVNSFLPIGDKTEEIYLRHFLAAVDFARAYLLRTIAYFEADEAEYKKVKALYEQSRDKRLIMSDEPFEWSHLVDYREPLVAVFPKEAEGDDWRAYTILKERHSFAARTSFPEAWRGLRLKDVEAVSGIVGAKFCHRAGFLFVADTKAGALAAAKAAIEEKQAGA